MCSEASPAKLAELLDFYKKRLSPSVQINLTEHAAAHLQTKPARQSPSGSTAPPEGELNSVRTSLLDFGKDSTTPKWFRPVVSLGKSQGPFYLALPQTTKRGRSRDFFEIGAEDYEANIGDDRRWPKWLHWKVENVPLGEKRRYLGHLRENTMNRAQSWRQERSAGSNTGTRSP